MYHDHDKIHVKCPTCFWEHVLESQSGLCAGHRFALYSPPQHEPQRTAFFKAVPGVNQHAPFVCLECGTKYQVDVANLRTTVLSQRLSEVDRLHHRVLVLQDALEDMTWQFAIHTEKNGVRVINDSCLSSLELAFDVLGWEDMMTEEQAMLKMQEPVEGLERNACS